MWCISQGGVQVATTLLTGYLAYRTIRVVKQCSEAVSAEGQTTSQWVLDNGILVAVVGGECRPSP